MTGPAEPLIIAHRGGADLWPENTLAAFAAAIDSGADGLEFDLQLTADGRLAVHHDAQLKPEATRRDGAFLQPPTPRLEALSWAELQLYDVGRLDPDSAYGRRRPARRHVDGARVPDLAALDRLAADTAKPGFKLYAELKTELEPAPDKAAALAEAYLAALEVSPARDRHIVISFDWRCVNLVRAARPGMAHAYTTMPFAMTDPQDASAASDTAEAAAVRAASAAGAAWWDGFDWRDMDGASHGEKVLRAIHAAGGNGWFAYWRDLTEETAALAADLGLDVSVWTVNEPDDMRAAAALGAKALITDRPDLAAAL